MASVRTVFIVRFTNYALCGYHMATPSDRNHAYIIKSNMLIDNGYTTIDCTAITVRSSIAQSNMPLVPGLGIARIEQQRYRTVHKCTVTAYREINPENLNLQLAS